MAYQVYFGDLTEENQALMLAVLKFKEAADALEPGEADVLYAIRGSSTPTPIPPEESGARFRQGGNSGGSGGGGAGGGRRGGSRRGGRRDGGGAPRSGGDGGNGGGGDGGSGG